MDELIEGYRKFRSEVWPAERAKYEALAHWGQSPETMILACSDSASIRRRSSAPFPAKCSCCATSPRSPRLTSRNSPGYHGTSAALEFGVRVLKVRRVVVLGHGQCGGVRALLYGAPPQARDFIANWVEIGKPARPPEGEKPNLADVEAAVVRVSLVNLMTFPWIATAVAARRLIVEGYVFDIHTGA